MSERWLGSTMKIDIKIPTDFSYFADEVLLSNDDQLINKRVAKLLKEQAYFADFPARHFIAYVWWEKTLSKWAAEVWVRNKYQCTFIAETIDTLSIDINAEYGLGEVEVI